MEWVRGVCRVYGSNRTRVKGLDSTSLLSLVQVSGVGRR
jgi:hypothetical protein